MTISIKIHVIDGTEITATGTADPVFKIIEAFETNAADAEDQDHPWDRKQNR